MNDDQAIAMLNTMASMQEEHNEQVHAEWRSQGYEYYRAIWVECAEMLDHYGWKWWKKQAPDLDQVKLELVDIWHFGLSEMIRAGTLRDQVGIELSQVVVAQESDAGVFRLAIETLAASTLQTRSFELEPFIEAMRTLPMSYTELYSMYIGKNVLNQFRQNNGYKTGEYRKLWQGREDNEHLVELLVMLQDDPSELPARLYTALTERYEASAD
jgi:dimeric dUTPase (all-alpha-NTP-PPase superfamily)